MLKLTQELFGAADPDRKRDGDVSDAASGWPPCRPRSSTS